MMSIRQSLKKLTTYSRNISNVRLLCSESPNTESSKESTKHQGGYAKAFEKFDQINRPVDDQPKTFASLLRNSKFVDLGDPEGKVVTGKIFHVIEDDLYIDFGWKFHCVCQRPKRNASSYVRGAKVRLLLKDLELSSKFLGFEKDLTLLEADAALIGLVQERQPTT